MGISQRKSLKTLAAPAEKADNKTLDRQKKIFEQENFLKIISDAVPIMIVILNKERQIVFGNNLFLEKLELEDISSSLGKRPGEVFNCLHADKYPNGCGTTEFCKKCGALKAILESQKENRSVEECRIINKDNNAMDFMITAIPYKTNNELFTIYSIEDISNEKRKQTLERIFFHDVLNIAGGIYGLSSILIEENDSDNIKQLSETIYKTSDNLVEEIKSQRQLNDAERGELKISNTKLFCNEILNDASLAMKAHKSAKNKIISINSRSCNQEFFSDPSILRRILINMIKNALEAIPEGEKVEVSCYINKQNQNLIFSVHNNTYIENSIQLQLFQRSFSTKGIGRGIGTYSMKLLGENYLKGKVYFESFKSKGTTFYLELPLKTKTDAC